MNIRPLESLTKEELIEIIRHERDHIAQPRKMVNDNAPAINKTSDSVLNAKYTDGYISGYVVACNFAASLASEAWVNHVFHTGLDGLIERCKNMEQALLEKAQACQDCTPAAPQPDHIPDVTKMVEPTDTEMLDWLIEESCTVLSFGIGVLSRKYKVIDFHGDDVSVGDTAREAIKKAMRGEE